MGKFLNKLERKFGRYAIRNLMIYVIGAYVLGAVISIINPYFYYYYLSLNVEEILHGQVWRLITFILEPMGSTGSPMGGLFFFINLMFYWFIGRNLENAWGAFRFNLYYLSGILLNIVAAFLMYAITKDPMSGMALGLTYINESLILAFCVLYPNVQILLFFFLPVKIKWLGIVYMAMILFNVVQTVAAGQWYYAVAILVALLNFFVFFFSTRNYARVSPKEIHRRRVYQQEVRRSERGSYQTLHGTARHRCAICGRTELDDPNLEFRFCSKCDGNYEYCQDHLFTHTHVKHTGGTQNT